MGEIIASSLPVAMYVMFIFTIFTATVDTTSSPQDNLNDFGCTVSIDVEYGGIFANCTHRNISSEDLNRLGLEETTTTLIISYNNIGVLPNNSLSALTHLRRLECLYCNLNVLQRDALLGLTNLEVLNLEENNLPIIEQAFPKGCFTHVPHLKKLFIEYNHNYGTSSNYSSYLDIFDFLPQLTDLALDSFYHLRIGSEFCKLKNLTNLRISTHHVQSISNDSLEGFQQCSSLHEFVLQRGTVRDRKDLGLGVFQFLPNISTLIIDSLHVGNRNLLAMMKPLRGKSFDVIVFLGVDLSEKYSTLDERTQDAILTQASMKYLTSIRVAQFAWLESAIFSFDTNSLFSPTWCQHLQSFAVETSGYLWSNVDSLHKLSMLKTLKRLSVITTSSGKLTNEFWNGVGLGDRDGEQEVIANGLRVERDKGDSHIEEARENVQSFRVREDSAPLDFFILPHSFLHRQMYHDHHQHHYHHHQQQQQQYQPQKTTSIGDKTVYVRIPPLLQTVELNGVHSLGINVVFVFRTNVATSLSITSCYKGSGLSLTGKMLGLDKLQSINFQDSKLTIALDFFDSFPNLTKLILRNTQGQFPASTASRYLDMHSARLLQNLTRLEYLDLAENGLFKVPPNKFGDLKFLSLASNYFSNIPVDFDLMPWLEILDLRDNLFVHLSVVDMKSVDNHIHYNVANFTILFGDNHLSCSCSNLPFIAWLQRRTDHFDQAGNYSCMSENGGLAYTAHYSDTKAFWRQCQGRNYMMGSLTFLFLLVSCYLAIFLGMKNRIQIVSKLRQLLLPGFRLQTREDFVFDVCIGYADEDALYVRDVLLKYLEDRWRLRTFVHQRDMTHDPLLMSEAIRNSWRCLILITEDFLFRCDMAHKVMKVASFFVTTNNPNNLVLMVEENVLHQIPDYVLQVVDEDNIIVLPRLAEMLQYREKEMLRTRLL